MNANQLSRRDMIRAAGATLALGAAAGSSSQGAEPNSGKPVVCVFSKPLGGRKFSELPAAYKEMGIDAVDLICRPKGHILPERVADDLPKAIEQFKAAGISVPMITTDIVDAGKGNADAVLKTAASLGIRYAKVGYHRYGDSSRVLQTLAEAKAKLRDVAALLKQHGVTGGYHNHSGRYVGTAMWDLWQMIQDLPPDAIGSYFDAAHATVEGGMGGWSVGLDLLSQRVVMLAVKDMKWAHGPRGWAPSWGPMGEGMVPWKAILAKLKKAKFAGPISLHIEYGEEGQAAGSEGEKAVMASIKQDLEYLRERLAEAGLA